LLRFWRKACQPGSQAGLTVHAGLNILLVDNDDVLAQMYRLKLVAEGHRVEIASDGSSGLGIALSRPPELLVLDIWLPDIDGLTLLAALREQPRGSDLPVIVLSNFEVDDFIERCRSLGALAFLLKSQTSPGSLAGMIAALQLPARS
jgi:two-component system chemotaxis sensor kinase CheA